MKKATLLAVLTALLSLNSFANTEATDVLGVRSQLRTEELRQRRAGRLVSGAAREIEWLLKDLQDNQLYDKQDGDVTTQMMKQLQDISSGRIPEAASILGRAREDVSAAGPHITSAEAEVQKILTDLASILKETTSGLAQDRLMSLLGELIDDEEELKNNTQKWGMKVILDRKAAKADTGRLHRLQTAVIPQYDDFFSLLKKTSAQVADEDDARTLTAIVKSLNKSKPDAQLKEAADGIKQTDPQKAIPAQKAVIAALREVYDILAAGADDLDLRARILKKLKDDQKKLYEAVKNQDHRKFPHEQSKHLAKQMDLNKEMDQFAKSQTPPSSPPPSSPPPSSPPPSSPPPSSPPPSSPPPSSPPPSSPPPSPPPSETQTPTGMQAPPDQAEEVMPDKKPMRTMEDDQPEGIEDAKAKAAEAEEQSNEALNDAQEKMNVAKEKLDQGNQQQAEQALEEAVKALEKAEELAAKSATSKAELNSLLEEALPNAGEEPPTPSPSLASPGDLPEVSPTDSESETQEDRSSQEAAEEAGEGEGEETGDKAGSEMPEGEGEMPGSVGKSETSTGEGDTPIGQPDPNAQESSSSEKKNPRDPNKPKMPAPAMHLTGQTPEGEMPVPPDGDMPPTEGAEVMDTLGGTSDTEASGEDYELKALAADVFKRGNKKGGLTEYLPQLPAEYRKQIKAYYEVLAQ